MLLYTRNNHDSLTYRNVDAFLNYSFVDVIEQNRVLYVAFT